MSRFFAVCAVLCLGWFLWEVSPEQYKRWPSGPIKTPYNGYADQDTVVVSFTIYRTIDKRGFIISQELNAWLEPEQVSAKYIRFSLDTK